MFENGAGYSRIYLSYLGCKFDLFTCLLVMVMIKTNTTRKQPRINGVLYTVTCPAANKEQMSVKTDI